MVERAGSVADGWAACIAARFFPLATTGPVYLSVDDESVCEIASELGSTPGSLLGEVQIRYRAPSGDRLRTAQLEADVRWQSSDDEAPPFLPLLAVCVLAASRMQADPEQGIGSNNYYTRLAPLLGLEAAGMPPGFDFVGRLWTRLAEWISESSRGTPTISTHPFFKNVGFPVSQCVFPERDRQRLPDFFRAFDLEPNEEHDADELLFLLRAWARPGCGLTESTLRALAAGDGWDAILATIVAAEYEDWDGSAKDERGFRRIEIVTRAVLSLGGRQLELRLFPRRPDGFPETVRTNTGELHELSEAFYQAIPAERTAKALERGLTLIAPSESFHYAPRPVVPLHEDPDLGGWVSCRRIRLDEPLMMLVRAPFERDVLAYLGQCGERGTVSTPTGIPAGWGLISNAVARLPKPVLPGPAYGALSPIAPRASGALRLEGGLAVVSVPAVYLVGEEPEIVLSLEQDDELWVDGVPQRLHAGSVRFSLAEMNLPAGDHEIRLGPVRRTFSTTPGYPGPTREGTGSRAFLLQRPGAKWLLPDPEPVQVSGDAPRGQVWISGASLRGDWKLLPYIQETVLVRQVGTNCTVVGAADDELLELEIPSAPTWLSDAGLTLGQQFFEVAPPFPAAWVICQGRFGPKPYALVAWPPLPAPRRNANPAWCKAVLAAADAEPVPASLKPMWSKYVEAASEGA
jgi:hypothetical protein